MVPRRHLLRLGAAGLAALAGCTGGDEPGTPTTTAPPTATPTVTPPPATPTPSPEPQSPDEDTPTPIDPDAWSPSWSIPIQREHVVAIDIADGTTYATASSDGGGATVLAIDPQSASVDWRSDLAGEAEPGASADDRTIARDQWGVTVDGAMIFSVAGAADEYEWTTLHALDRRSGERRWRLRRERSLTYQGSIDGTVIATGREFFEPETTHDTPKEPLTTVIYGIDRETGRIRWERSFRAVIDADGSPQGVYVAAGDRLIALGLDGTTRWTHSADDEARTVVATPDRVIFLARRPDRASLVRGFDHAGDREWQHRLPVDEVLFHDGRLFLGGHQVLRLASDGSVVWQNTAVGQWLLLDPAGDTLYTRAGRAQDRISAYDAASGEHLWTFVPPDLSSRNAWPVAATDGTAIAEGITAESGDEPFTSLYKVDAATGELERSIGWEPVFDVETVGGSALVAGDDITAFDAE